MNPIGEIGIFWCEKCCEKHEPELYKNEMEDKPQIVKDLEEICYSNH
jgi:hypothetical protein